MKKKLLVVLGALLVLGLFFSGCSSDGDSAEKDPFEGTWVNTAQGLKLEAANKAWKIFRNNVEMEKGTYTFSGNTVTGEVTEVNMGVFTGGANNWVKTSDLTSAQKATITQYGGTVDAFTITINGNTLTNMGYTFTKQ